MGHSRKVYGLKLHFIDGLGTIEPNLCEYWLQGSRAIVSDQFRLCSIPYSAKFLRRIIFAVFADSSRTAKIKLLETFRLMAQRG